jgi:cytoskeletal protein RodZ
MKRVLTVILGLLLVIGLVVSIPVAASASDSKASSSSITSSTENSNASGSASASAWSSGKASAKSLSVARNYSVTSSSADAAAANNDSYAGAASTARASNGSVASSAAAAESVPQPGARGFAYSLSSDVGPGYFAVGVAYNVTAKGKSVSRSAALTDAKNLNTADALAYSSSNGGMAAGDIWYQSGTSSAVTSAVGGPLP